MQFWSVGNSNFRFTSQGETSGFLSVFFIHFHEKVDFSCLQTTNLDIGIGILKYNLKREGFRHPHSIYMIDRT